MMPRFKNAFAVVAVLMMITLALPAVGQNSYTVTDLGALSGYPNSVGKGINGSGQVVGYAWSLDSTGHVNGFHAFAISPPYTSIIDLGTLGGSTSQAFAINASGQITGNALTSSNALHTFLVNLPDLTMHDLDPGTGDGSEGFGINSAGEIVGIIHPVGAHAMLTVPTYSSLQDLGTLGGSQSHAFSINDSGLIVGDSNLSGDTAEHAFLYSNGSMSDLGTFGGVYSFAYGINSSGQITGTSTDANGAFHGYVLSPPNSTLSAATDMGSLGGTQTIGQAINTSGQVVGGSTLAADNLVTHAILYTTTNGLVDLNTLIPANSGWTLIEAWGINDSGQITGEGTNPAGQHHAFLLTPAGPSADLAIRSNAPATVKPGQKLTYAIAVANKGPNDTTQVSVTDTLPAGVTFQSATTTQGTCNAGATLTCNLGTIPAAGGVSISVKVTVTAASGTTLSNTATVSGNGADPNPGNNTSTTSTAVR